jgi:glycosyltransferase involved in cell wall biosynthesis
MTEVSVLVFTLNEEKNLDTCLDCLDWCDDKFVVDSYSTDRTRDICEGRGVPFVQHAFDGFGTQRNWALQNLDLKYDWVLILDADERVPPELSLELAQLAATNRPHMGAYRLKRRFYMWGRWLRYSSLYPSWVVRFVHRRKVEYVNRGHGETQKVNGEVGEIRSFLIDENHKGLDEWFSRHVRYARKEAEYELDREELPWTIRSVFDADPLQRRAALKRFAGAVPGRAQIYFLYCYIARLGFLDGRDGFVFCRMKSIYQNMIAIEKHDLRKRQKQ